MRLGLRQLAYGTEDALASAANFTTTAPKVHVPLSLPPLSILPDLAKGASLESQAAKSPADAQQVHLSPVQP